jgi:hypothetical protein
VFFPGWPAPHNHVVFAAVEAEHDITGICQSIGETLVVSKFLETFAWSKLNANITLRATAATRANTHPVETPKRLKDRATRLANNL